MSSVPRSTQQGADVWLVPHTHWDREWYEPFQRFRLRLVDLMDDVTSRSQAQPGFRFTMDGQMAAVEDYLEVRPEQREVVRGLVAGNQLAVGPWRVLMDEFLCSGETMIRNLEMGWAAAATLGDPMPVGYLPDMFGHCAQMPQILRLAGLGRACVWRGVPASVDRHEFLWRSPDGTGIRTEYLASGYGNAADLFTDSTTGADPASVRARLVERLVEQRHWFGDDAFLAMYGTDHAAPLPSLMQQVATLDDQPGGPRVRVATLAEYLELAHTDETQLRVVEGELRSHARANILPGVISVRWHLKDAMARAERMLARYAEPFAALWLPDWPQVYLDIAWGDLVDSSCHDSVTGCGVDETALQVAARIAEGEHAAQAVRDRALTALARAVPLGSLLVVNPSPAPRTDQFEVTIPVPEDWSAVALRTPGGDAAATQELGRPAQALARERVPSHRLAALLRRVHDRELFGLQVVRIDMDETERVLTFHVADQPGARHFDPVVERNRVAEVAARAGAADEWEVITLDEPRRRLVCSLGVDALAPVSLTPTSAPRPATGLPSGTGGAGLRDSAAVIVTADSVGNGWLTAELRPDGALRLTAADGTVLDGVGALRDEGDAGDSYNYGPPGLDRVVDVPERVRVTVLESGPLRGALEVARDYLLPTRVEVDGSRSETTEPVTIVTRVELRAGERFLRLALAWENRSRDHRLRLMVPLARHTESSHADGQLAVVERPLVPEGGSSGELPIATYPAERFVDAGGAGVLVRRTMEYEVVGEAQGQQLALTLLRSIGYLSRNVHPFRDEPAGPQSPTPSAQCLGPVTVELAVLPHAGDWRTAGLVTAAEGYLHPVIWAGGAGLTGGSLPEPGPLIEGDGVVMTALRRRGAWLELRVAAETTEAVTARISSARVWRDDGSCVVAAAAARRCDLLGRPGEEVPVRDGVVELPLRPWEIATIQLGGPDRASSPGDSDRATAPDDPGRATTARRHVSTP